MRLKCYQCMRPKSSCLCHYCQDHPTRTKIVILMHPHEFRKVKNGTGRLTHLQLPNSEIIYGIDFTKNEQVNAYINQGGAYLLYPGREAINLSSCQRDEKIVLEKMKTIFLLDATWQCAKKMMTLSSNLHRLPKLSFDVKESSRFSIKMQPDKLCLSTIESTQLLLLQLCRLEIEEVHLSDFLDPFLEMLKYQEACIKNPDNKVYRPKHGQEIRPQVKPRLNRSHALLFEMKN